MGEKMKKLLTTAMAISVMATSLVGCSTSAPQSTATDTTKTETEANDQVEPTQSSSEDKVITFWNSATSEADKATYVKSVELFNATNTSGYTIEMTSIANDVYKEKIAIAMSSGECPDIYTSWSGGPMFEYVESGFAQPVTELFQATPNYDKVLEAAIAQGTYKGELYGIPHTNTTLSGIFYNTEMFEKYGLEVPTTIAELEEVCDVFVENGITPFSLANANKWTGSMYFMNLAARFGGLEPFAAAVAGDGTFEDESFIYAGEKIQEWVNKGYFPEGVNSMDEDLGQARQLLYQESAAMQLIGSWAASTIKGESEAFYAKLGWFPFPAIEGKEEFGKIAIGTIGDQFMSFNCTGEKLEVAVEYAAIFSTPEMIDQMLTGGKVPPIEGASEAVTDPSVMDIMKFADTASTVQLWYDQYLPPSVAATHLDTCQSLFGLSMMPEEAAAKFEESMEAALSK